MALTARTFGQRPSGLLGIEDKVLALAVDLAAAVRLNQPAEEADGERLERGFTF